MKISTRFDVGQLVSYQGITCRVVVVYMHLHDEGFIEKYFIDGGLGIRKKVPADELIGTGPGVERETLFDVGDVIHHVEGPAPVRTIRWSKSHMNEVENYLTYDEKTMVGACFNRKSMRGMN